MNEREALERIAKYPMSRSEEISIETAREIAREALASVNANEQSQAQQPEYTFDQLTKLLMQAATKEGHKVTLKIKWAQSLPPHQTEQWKAVPFSTTPAPEGEIK